MRRLFFKIMGVHDAHTDHHDPPLICISDNEVAGVNLSSSISSVIVYRCQIKHILIKLSSTLLVLRLIDENYSTD